jgi:hypothetical protein
VSYRQLRTTMKTYIQPLSYGYKYLPFQPVMPRRTLIRFRMPKPVRNYPIQTSRIETSIFYTRVTGHCGVPHGVLSAVNTS